MTAKKSTKSAGKAPDENDPADADFYLMQGYLKCFLDNVLPTNDEAIIAQSFAQMMVTSEHFNVDSGLVLSLMNLSINDNLMSPDDLKLIMLSLVNQNAPAHLIGFVEAHFRKILG